MTDSETVETGEAEAETALGPAATEAPEADPRPERPADVPEKFWDAERGGLRTEALLKSYQELERKLGQMLPAPSGEDDVEALRRLQRALGVPETPEDYAIATRHPLVEPDPEVNARLHAAGFTQAQAELVYELAAERLLPAIETAVSELEQAGAAERLAEHFGGPEAFRETARQLKTWGKAKLPEEVFDALAASYDGVLALHQMMQADEPHLGRSDGAGDGRLDETGLQAMMRDPRYWRDRDPAFVAEVTEGFRRLYPS